MRQSAVTALAAVSDVPARDAKLLFAHAGGDAAAFEAFVARRLAHEPVAYILGSWSFWSIDLAVGPGVLIPRPDSEALIEAAIAHFPDRAARLRILDLGTGPGTLLLAALAEYPNATGVGIDCSVVALGFARHNASALGLGHRVELRGGDWADGISERFDLVLCNPPYVEDKAMLDPQVRDWEPHGALFAGEDGLAAYRQLAPVLSSRISPGGIACIEIGHNQRDALTALFAPYCASIVCTRDLGGRDRCLIITPK